jgi:1-acyl-sn-glycerol-3-phosphate acyltransferase
MFPADMPPVKNWPLYCFRVFGKWFSFFFFGFSSFLLIIIFLPLLRLLFHPQEKFKKTARRFVSGSFRFFVGVMNFIGIVDLNPGDRKAYRNFTSKVIVANHPSLLDVVMIISLVPNADCIVASYLRRHFLKFIVKQLYIISTADNDEILKASESLKQGNCIIVFPEGSRTPRTGRSIIRKGAARIALFSGCNVVPIHIGGTDKYGLGKKDPWPGFNTREKYVYNLSIGKEIAVEGYKSHSHPGAVRALTNDIKDALFPPIDNQTINNL